MSTNHEWFISVAERAALAADKIVLTEEEVIKMLRHRDNFGNRVWRITLFGREVEVSH